jgi:hypothetical protein
LYPPTLIFNILNLPSSFDIEEYFDPVGVWIKTEAPGSVSALKF